MTCIYGSIKVYEPNMKLSSTSLTRRRVMEESTSLCSGHANTSALYCFVHQSVSDSLTPTAHSLPYWYDALKDAWNRRDADHKFKIVCYVHNAKDMEWDRWIPYWAQRNAIRLLAIGSQYVSTSSSPVTSQPLEERGRTTCSRFPSRLRCWMYSICCSPRYELQCVGGAVLRRSCRDRTPPA